MKTGVPPGDVAKKTDAPVTAVPSLRRVTRPEMRAPGTRAKSMPAMATFATVTSRSAEKLCAAAPAATYQVPAVTDPEYCPLALVIAVKAGVVAAPGLSLK